MAELQKFQESLEGKSANTIKAYTQQYKKLRKLLEKDVIESSQDTIIDTVRRAENPNSRQALLNIGILIRQANKYAIDKLIAYRTKLTALIKDSVKENNKRRARVSQYEKERQKTINNIRSKQRHIKENYDDLSEREIHSEQVRIFYLNNYVDFLTRKIEKNNV